MSDASAEHRTIRARRGATLECKGWQQEAALRMLHNNLDPDVAEHPAELVVYGGTGKAARDWASLAVIERELRETRGQMRPSWCSPGGQSAC